MKNSSEVISESVFTTNLKFLKKQNETKEIFFKYLNENKSYEEFRRKIIEIWGTLDHKFLDEQLLEYQELIYQQNKIADKEIVGIEKDKKNMIFMLIPISLIINQENRLVNYKLREYDKSLNSYAYKANKQEYLKTKVKRYSDEIVEYISHTPGKKSRYVSLNTYASMIQNTNMTLSGWNEVINEAIDTGNEEFIIPYHPFSCPECIRHQGKVMSLKDVYKLIGYIGKPVEVMSGDILHPNCKCELHMIQPGQSYKSIINKYSDLSKKEKKDIYHIKQKTNTLTLKKERIKTDMKIQDMLGNQDEVDKLNQQRNKINASIRALKEALPTDALRKQVVAIKR